MKASSIGIIASVIVIICGAIIITLSLIQSPIDTHNLLIGLAMLLFGFSLVLRQRLSKGKK